MNDGKADFNIRIRGGAKLVRYKSPAQNGEGRISYRVGSPECRFVSPVSAGAIILQILFTSLLLLSFAVRARRNQIKQLTKLMSWYGSGHLRRVLTTKQEKQNG